MFRPERNIENFERIWSQCFVHPLATEENFTSVKFSREGDKKVNLIK